jgi:hypothetical protein
MKTFICQEENPELYDVLAAFFALRGYVEFRYTKLPELKKALTPSAAKAREFTKMPENEADWNLVKGHVTAESLKMTKDGNFTLTLRNILRKVKGDKVDEQTGEILEESYFADKSNAQEDGTRKIGFVEGEYQYRSIRLDVRNDGYGIDLASILVNIGGKKRLFPNARPNVRPEFYRNLIAAIVVGDEQANNIPI